MDCKSFDDEVRYLGLCTLGEKRNNKNLAEVFKIFKGWIVCVGQFKRSLKMFMFG